MRQISHFGNDSGGTEGRNILQSQRIFSKIADCDLADMFADKPLNIPGRVFDPYQRKKPASVKITPEQLRLLP